MVGMVFFSCDSTTIQDIQPIVANPKYNSNIKPIMTAKCISCHSSNGQYPALTNYAEVVDAIENGTLQCRIQNSCGAIMPPSGKLPQSLIDMVNNWKLQGYVQ